MAEPDDLTTRLSITSTYLLEGLKDPGNHAVWQQYVDRYRPMIVTYATKLGLSTADAEDVAQQSLVAFCTGYQEGKYDRQRGRLREWLFGIARNQILNHRRRRNARGEVQVTDSSGGTDFFGQVPDEDRWSALWEEEWRNSVMQDCLAAVRSEVQPATFEAFDLFACQGWPAERVAAHLKITPNAVFGAKRRVLHRVRELLPEVEAVW